MKRFVDVFLIVLVALNGSMSASAEETLPKFTKLSEEESGLGLVNPNIQWPWLSAAVDIDNDGDLDFCQYGHHGIKPTSPGRAGGGTWYLNDGKGHFTPSPDLSAWTFGSQCPNWIDMNNDGVLDAIGKEWLAGQWFINDGKGTFRNIGKVGYGIPVDMDGDGIFQEIASEKGYFSVTPPLTQAPADVSKFVVNKGEFDPMAMGVDKMKEGGESIASWRPALGLRYCIDMNDDNINDLLYWRVLFTYKSAKHRSPGMRSWIALGRKGKHPLASNEALNLPDEGRHCFVPEDLNCDGFMDIVDAHSGEIYLFDSKEKKFKKSDRRLFPDNDEYKANVFDGDGHVWFLDLGNTGKPCIFPEFKHGYPNYGGKLSGLFVHDGNMNFERVVPEWMGIGRKSDYYIIPADFDNDGDLDVVVNTRGKKPLKLIYYRNEGIPGNHWIRVRPLQSARSNFAMGCKLWVYKAGRLGDPKGLLYYTQAHMNRTKLHQTVEQVMHVGLGKFDKVDFRLRFPISGKVVDRKDLTADRVIAVNEE